MGATISSNAATMATDVYTSALSTTNVANVNQQIQSSNITIDDCVIVAGGNVDITQNSEQALQAQQYSTIYNSQIAATDVNQQLLQQAQSTTSGWGIGVASATNNMNITASVASSLTSAINVSNTNVNSSSQSITCVDSTIVATGDVSISQTSSQSLAATQTADVTQMQSVTTTVDQAASQSATATVTGFSLSGIIIIVAAVFVGVVVLKMAFQATTTASSSSSSSAANELARWQRLMFYAVFWCAVTGIALTVAGALGFKQRTAWACNTSTQCSSSNTNFVITSPAPTCTCDSNSGCDASGAQMGIADVAPPLFMCNPVQSETEFGSQTGSAASLYPGCLQWMVVSKYANAYLTNSPMRNNNGYNLMMYNHLLQVALGTGTAASSSSTTSKYVSALLVYMQRQIMSKDAVTGWNNINTPNSSTSLSQWCKARICQNLVPIQPVFAAPDGSADGSTDGSTGITSSNCVSMTGASTAVSKLLNRNLKKPKVSNLTKTTVRAAKSQQPFSKPSSLKQTLKPSSSRLSALQRAVRALPKRSALSTSSSSSSSSFSKNRSSLKNTKASQRQPRPALLSHKIAPSSLSAKQKTRLTTQTVTWMSPTTTSSTTNSTCAGGVKYATPAFSSSQPGPSGFNLFADVCYKATGNTSRPYVFKSPDTSTCGTGCTAFPSSGKMVTNITVLSPGSGGYTENTTVIITGGRDGSSGVSAIAKAHINTISGTVWFVEVTSPGSGYTSSPTIQIVDLTTGANDATATATLRSFCVKSSDNTKLCAPNCGSGWSSLPRTQPKVLTSPCSDTGSGSIANATASSSVPVAQQSYMKNLMRTAGIDGTDNSTTRCYVPALGGDAEYTNDKNLNQKYNQECATTPGNTSTDTRCMFSALDNQVGNSVPAWMALRTNYLRSNNNTDVYSTDVGFGLSNSDFADTFFVDFTNAGVATDSAETWTMNSTNRGDYAYFNSAVSYNTSNPYCNAIIGLCQSTDSSRADYDADCPAERQANYISGSNGNRNYFSTCAQQPIQACTAYITSTTSTNNVADSGRVCGIDSKQNCFTKTLCTAMDGYWTWDSVNQGYYCSSTSLAETCPSESLYTSSSSTTPCAASGSCSSCGQQSSCEAANFVGNDACAAACSALSTQVKCTGSNSSTCGTTTSTVVMPTSGQSVKCKCAWTDGACTATVPLATSSQCSWTGTTCVSGCNPSANVCDTCANSGTCTAPCSWDGFVDSVVVTNGGSGYSADTVEAYLSGTSGEGGSGASFVVNLAPGQVTSIEVTSEGSGYAAVPKVVITRPSGSGTSSDSQDDAVATATVLNGVVVSIFVVSGGSMYSSTSPPTVTLATTSTSAKNFSATAQVVNGAVQSITIQNGGTGYGPVVSFDPSTYGAIAQAQVGTDGKISSVTVIDPGSGFTSTPKVTITGSSSTKTNATLVATALIGSISSIDVVNTGTGYSVGSQYLLTISGEGKGSGASALANVKGSCFLGVNVCGLLTSSQGGTSDTISTSSGSTSSDALENLYVVRLPSAFHATLTSTSTTSTVSGCLPNVFVPDVANDSNLPFLNNCDAAVVAVAEKVTAEVGGSYRSGCPATATATTTTPVSTATFKTTCLRKTSTTAALSKNDYWCGCPSTSGEPASTCQDTGTSAYSDDDYLCYVKYDSAAKNGGFVLRSVASFDSASCASALYNPTCSSDKYNDLALYAATTGTSVNMWSQVNVSDQQSTRLFMFLRVFYWLLLTTDTSTKTMTELGLSTFVNDLGYTGTTPNVSMTAATDLQASAYYKTQPLLVTDDDGTPHFYTLQELLEGALPSDATTVSTERVILANQQLYLSQLNMWCFNPSSMGLSTDLSASGFNVLLTTETSNTAGALAQATLFRGLHYGAFGYCSTWFTSDLFVGLTLGFGSVLLAGVVSLIVYLIIKRIQKAVSS
jgi:hypothetical protein